MLIARSITSLGLDMCRFQEFTLTDQDMVPPGRVMYLRCFKASPKPPVLKLERRLDLSASNGAASEGERHQCGGQQDWHSDTGATSAEQEQPVQDLCQRCCHGLDKLLIAMVLLVSLITRANSSCSAS